MYLTPEHLQRQRARLRTSGGVLLVALLITCAATFGFAAWASLIGQRRQVVEEVSGGIQRRLAVENGRQMARQYALTGVLTKNSGTAVSFTKTPAATSQVLGGITAPAFTGYAMDSTSFPTFNRLSPAGTGYAYGTLLQVSVPFSIMDYYPTPTVKSSGTTTAIAAMKSRPALPSGDLLVIHEPTLSTTAPVVTGNLDVQGGRAVFLTTGGLANLSTVRATAVAIPHYPVPSTNALATRDPQTNNVIVPSNFPQPISTTGPVVAGNSIDLGNRLNVIDSALNPSNSFREKIKQGSYTTLNPASDLNQNGLNFVASTGVLTLDLANENLTSVIIDNNVTEIILTGQNSAAAESAVQDFSSVAICYVEDDNVTTKRLSKITCQNSGNARRVIIGIKKLPKPSPNPQIPGLAVTVAFPSSDVAPQWRLMLVAENTPLLFSASGGPGVITLKGGIQTDSAITATTGVGNRVRLILEDDPRRLVRLAPRRGWVEHYLDYANGSL
jgi:hypothetical protein